MIEPKELGARIKEEREKAGLTQKELGERIGVSHRVIAKIEAGTQEATASRLSGIAFALNTSVAMLMGEPIEIHEPETRQITYGNDEAHTPNSALSDCCAQNKDRMIHSQQLLSALGEMREQGFNNAWMSAPRALGKLTATLNDLDGRELLELAEKCSLFRLTEEQINTLLEGEDDSNELFNETTARIIDTAIIGRDLHSVKSEDLKSLANDLDIEPDDRFIVFGSWSSIETLIKAIRPALRERGLKELGPDLLNLERFRQRSI